MTAADQEAIVGFQDLLCLLSRTDNLKMFTIAVEGLVINISTLDTLKTTPKRYYRALKQLKDAGLIEKDKKGCYVHTTFGSLVYQRIILELSQYRRHLDKMQMIDTLRHAGKFSEASILTIAQEIMDNIIKPSSFLPPAISESINNKIDIILSFDKVIQTLLERIDCCNSELLIATRICPETVINKILEKSKLGVKVKVIADIDLVKEYFRTQQKFVDNFDKSKNKKDHIKERKCVIANPWYPDKTINRRIADIPFGMIILDNTEVGIELVNSNNPKEFYGGIIIRDKNIAMMAAKFYQQLWEKASESMDGMD